MKQQGCVNKSLGKSKGLGDEELQISPTKSEVDARVGVFLCLVHGSTVMVNVRVKMYGVCLWLLLRGTTPGPSNPPLPNSLSTPYPPLMINAP